MNKESKVLILALLLSIIIPSAISDLNSSEIEVGRRVARHVVSFNILDRDNDRFATGFHLRYKNNTYIVTNKHVCDMNTDEVNDTHIQFEDYVGKIIAIDNRHDLCLVTSNRKEGLTLADKQTVPLDKVVLVGHPRGLGKTIRYGHHIEAEQTRAPWISNNPFISYDSIMISTIAYGGNSGSPIANMDGEVIGVLYAGDNHHTEVLIVPLKHLKDFLRRNIK